jgi:hypothetical protein
MPWVTEFELFLLSVAAGCLSWGVAPSRLAIDIAVIVVSATIISAVSFWIGVL